MTKLCHIIYEILYKDCFIFYEYGNYSINKIFFLRVNWYCRGLWERKSIQMTPLLLISKWDQVQTRVRISETDAAVIVDRINVSRL